MATETFPHGLSTLILGCYLPLERVAGSWFTLNFLFEPEFRRLAEAGIRIGKARSELKRDKISGQEGEKDKLGSLPLKPQQQTWSQWKTAKLEINVPHFVPTSLTKKQR